MEPLIFVLPICYAAILWWFTTGLIMAVYRSSRLVIQWWFAVATVVMLGACVGLYLSAQNTDLKNVYLAYTCGVVIWGWIVAAYYLDFVTGPKRTPAGQAGDEKRKPNPHVAIKNSATHPVAIKNPATGSLAESDMTANNPVPTALVQDELLHSSSSPSPIPHRFPGSLFDRFQLALRASIHHEFLALGMGLVVAAITLPQPNRWGLWIFLTLWLMHTSAKLNVFFGVRNFRVDFLPEHLHYLEALIVKRSNNVFFPFSICFASSVTLAVFYQAIAPGATATQSSGSLLIVTMLTLGIIEHWLLVIPLPAMIWGWGMRKLPATEVPEFCWEDVPFLYRPLTKLLMAKRSGTPVYRSLDRLLLHSLAADRVVTDRCPAAIGQLSKPVIES
ncbi:MAG: DUF3623 domain-containing protein [Caldilineaceae bacterium]|nr:DUF3623 domain-containing protein [Caldilineaceae bacterium]